MIADLLTDGEEPDAVAPILAEVLRNVNDYPGTVADALAPLAHRFGLRRNDGLALLRWLVELSADPDASTWIDAARAHVARSSNSNPTETSVP